MRINVRNTVRKFILKTVHFNSLYINTHIVLQHRLYFIYSIYKLIYSAFFCYYIYWCVFFNVPRFQFPTTVHLVVVPHIIMLPSWPPAIYPSLFLLLWETTRHIRQVILSELEQRKCVETEAYEIKNIKLGKVAVGCVIWQTNSQGCVKLVWCFYKCSHRETRFTAILNALILFQCFTILQTLRASGPKSWQKQGEASW